jgi:subtilisin family serine protease
VAGIAAAGSGDGVGTAGIAPSARVVPVRVLDAAGTGSSSDVARGITWAVDHGAEVVNVSLGGPYTSAVDLAVDYAESRGVLVVAAAGNAGPTGPRNYPAALDEVLAVASHDQGGGISSFSTQGSYVDLSAPGSGIVSTFPDNRWASMSGTSMATPHVAGAAALLASAEPTLTPAQLRTRLRSTATDAGVVGFDVAYGWGRLDLVRALTN